MGFWVEFLEAGSDVSLGISNFVVGPRMLVVRVDRVNDAYTVLLARQSHDACVVSAGRAVFDSRSRLDRADNAVEEVRHFAQAGLSVGAIMVRLNKNMREGVVRRRRAPQQLPTQALTQPNGHEFDDLVDDDHRIHLEQ
jgi:hypothetical protein